MITGERLDTSPPQLTGGTMSIFAEDLTKDFELEGIKITIKKLSLQDQMNAAKKLSDGNEAEASVELLIASIAKWDAKDKENNACTIDAKTVGKMRGDIAAKIVNEITDFNGLKAEEVKN